MELGWLKQPFSAEAWQLVDQELDPHSYILWERRVVYTSFVDIRGRNETRFYYRSLHLDDICLIYNIDQI